VRWRRHGGTEKIAANCGICGICIEDISETRPAECLQAWSPSWVASGQGEGEREERVRSCRRSLARDAGGRGPDRTGAA
jgi:ribosomal protein L34E